MDDLTIFVPNLVATLISVTLLTLAYELLKTNWPDYYFSTSEENSLYVTLKPSRLLTFRAAPIFAIILPILGILGRDYGNQFLIITGLIIASIHALITNGKAIYLLSTNSTDIKTFFNKHTQIIYHIFTVLFCIVCGALSGYFAQNEFIKNISPSLAGMRDNLWSSILVVLVCVYSLKSYKQEVNMDRVFDTTLKKISPKIKMFLKETCIKYHANYDLALAICITESIQRPLWIRKLEKLKSFFIPHGTYGIMQVKSDHHISDKISIEKAVKSKLDNSIYLDQSELFQIIKNYNSSSNFQIMTEEAYRFLTP